MSCTRCQGFMVGDRYHSSDGPVSTKMWRCMNCGDVVDVQILAYRAYRVSRAPRPIPPAVSTQALPPLAVLLASE